MPFNSHGTNSTSDSADDGIHDGTYSYSELSLTLWSRPQLNRSYSETDLVSSIIHPQWDHPSSTDVLSQNNSTATYFPHSNGTLPFGRFSSSISSNSGLDTSPRHWNPTLTTYPFTQHSSNEGDFFNVQTSRITELDQQDEVSTEDQRLMVCLA